MKTTKEEFKYIVKQYMLDQSIGYLQVTASMSVDRSNVVLSMTEDEDNPNHLNGYDED